GLCGRAPRRAARGADGGLRQAARRPSAHVIRTLDLRDRMTARHSAAVAHYAREIAAAIGMSEEEQEVVHTAGLLHDIGKFNLPDDILKADKPLDDAEWELIRAHPEEGARLISHIEGYGPAADLVRAHH